MVVIISGEGQTTEVPFCCYFGIELYSIKQAMPMALKCVAQYGTAQAMRSVFDVHSQLSWGHGCFIKSDIVVVHAHPRCHVDWTSIATLSSLSDYSCQRFCTHCPCSESIEASVGLSACLLPLTYIPL